MGKGCFPDHPAISGAGYDNEPCHVCPNCGEDLYYEDKVYQTLNGVIVGCRFCIEERDAEDAF